MTVLEWPASLPPLRRDGFGARRQDNRRRLGSEGPPRYRRRYSLSAREVSLAIEGTRAQWAIFQDFHGQVTRDGTLPFYLPDPILDGQRIGTQDGAVLTDASGAPLVLASRWLCLFGDAPPQDSIVSDAFRIEFSVWVMP
ncbi:MAG: hypothetical protein AAF618_00090 [Pseudomonadota bacterium]